MPATADRQRLLLLAAAGAVLAASSAAGQEILRDDFNGTSLNTGTWQVMTHQVGRSLFGNVPAVSGGFARLRHDTYNPSSPGTRFRGTELATNAFLSRGTLGIEMEARVRSNAMASGLVTSFFTYNYRVENGTGFSDEADFEFLSSRINAAPPSGDPVQVTTFNDFNNTTQPYGDEITQSSREIFVNGLDTTQFNTVKFRWLPQRLEWYLNGRLLRTVTGSLVPTDATRMRFNFWAPSSDWQAAYSSALQPTANPAQNVQHFYDVDWVVVRHARPAVTATAPDRVFTDRFNNGSVANSDQVPAFWSTRNQGASSAVAESSAVPLKLTASGAGYPHAQIASGVRDEFNFFEAPIEIEATGINFDSPSGSYGKSYLRFALSSQALTAGTQSEYTSEDAFSLRIGGDNSIGLGFKVNSPNVSTEFEGVNLLNQTVSGPVRRIKLVVHPTFYKLNVEHDLSLADSTPTTSQFSGTLSLNLNDWAVLAGAATGNSAMYVQSQLANSAAGESTTAMVESLAVDVVRSTWAATGNGDWHAPAGWSSAGVPDFRGANVVLPAGATGRTISLNTAATIGRLSVRSGAAPYTIAGTGSLTIDTPARAARVELAPGVGMHRVQVPVNLVADVTFDVAANSELALEAGLTAAGAADITKAGVGALGVAHLRTGGRLSLTTGEIYIPPSASPNAPGGASRVGGLFIHAGPTLPVARLAIANNALIVDYDAASPVTDVRDYLAAGVASSFGIVSLPATGDGRHGYFEATDLFTSFPAEFAGLALDETSVLLAYTLPGDTNLDYRVDIGDFSALAAAFNAPSRWRQGDFDYDGMTGIADFSLLAARFNQSLATLARPGAAVPEPGAVSLLFLAALLKRRRRRPSSRGDL